MVAESKHLSEWIDADVGEVYAYARDPANLPQWAPGLGSAAEQVDGQWYRARRRGAGSGSTSRPLNEFGVLDHDVDPAFRRGHLQPDAGDQEWRRQRGRVRAATPWRA